MSEQLLKAGVTVSEMARMVGLSRARFYQLQKEGVFPPPKHDPSKNRPFYDQELQEVCLEVRRKNCGVNGKVVLFYARRQEIAPSRRTATAKAEPKKGKHADLIDGLKSLGLGNVTAEQVEEALVQTFGSRTSEVNQGEVVRAVFLFLKRRDTAGNVGR